jgi:hypothetical protein
MTDIGEIKSPYLRRVIQERGINDQQVISLLIVERYFREPEPTNPVVALMLNAIDRDHPAEAAAVRRELELVKTKPEREIKEIQPTADAKYRALQARVTATGEVSEHSKREQLPSGAAQPSSSSPCSGSVEDAKSVEAMTPSPGSMDSSGGAKEQSSAPPSASATNPSKPNPSEKPGSRSVAPASLARFAGRAPAG